MRGLYYDYEDGERLFPADDYHEVPLWDTNTGGITKNRRLLLMPDLNFYKYFSINQHIFVDYVDLNGRFSR